jgi:type III pantothenate kinase
MVILPEDPMPFISLYKTPETLGSDRKMLVNGANVVFPGIPRLVVSLGTCITYDWISSDQIHQGGYICPGLNMRWDSMHRQTGRLPGVPPPDLQLSEIIPATDTHSALQWGVVWAVRHEIRGFWNQLMERDSDFSMSHLIITGGDAHFFEIRAEEKIFAAPYLTLIGLRAML